MATAVNVKDLCKSFGQKKLPAVDSISLHVNRGELFGLIGPDGAGKTTLIRMMTTLLRPDFGRATVFSFDTRNEYSKIRGMMGYVPGRFSLYQDLSIDENLQFFASLSRSSMAESLSRTQTIYQQIEPFKHRRAGQLSGGMKQKLALCCALIHNPDILFLDEPTTGVDPVARREFWQILADLKNSGVTIVVSTSYMDEARLCDRIALMNQGRVLALNDPIQLIKLFPHRLYEIKGSNRFTLIGTLRNFPEVSHVYAFGIFAHLILKDEVDKTSFLARLALAGQQDIVFRPVPPDIEDYFIHLLQDDHSKQPHQAV